MMRCRWLVLCALGVACGDDESERDAPDASVVLPDGATVPSPTPTPEQDPNALTVQVEVVDDPSVTPVCASCGDCSESIATEPPTHSVEPVNYVDGPPAGGPHNGCWARWGEHAEEILDDNWVHNLEHGGIVFLHNCPDGCAEELEQLSALAGRLDRTLLTPHAALPSRFGVIAWGQRLVSECYDEAAFEAFHTAFFDRAPESVAGDPPSACP